MIKKAYSLYWSHWNKTQQSGLHEMKYIDPTDIALNSKLISDIKVSGPVKDSDTVFFHSTSMIPRYKFGKFCEGKKMRRVINLDKATVCVLNLQTLKANINLQTKTYKRDVYIFKVSDLKQWNGFALQVPAGVTDDDDVIIEPNTYILMVKSLPIPAMNTLSTHTIHCLWGHRNSDVKEIMDGLEDLQKIMQNSIRIIDDKLLNEQMAEGAIVVNAENYDDFKNMLTSKNTSDVRLGLELMANTNYLESQFYISLLLNSHRDIIRAYMSSTVNLKNFFDFFKDIQWDSGRPRFMSSLRKNLVKTNCNDAIKEAVIRKELLYYANEQLKSVDIRVKDVYFADEV